MIRIRFGTCPRRIFSMTPNINAIKINCGVLASINGLMILAGTNWKKKFTTSATVTLLIGWLETVTCWIKEAMTTIKTAMAAEIRKYLPTISLLLAPLIDNRFMPSTVVTTIKKITGPEIRFRPRTQRSNTGVSQLPGMVRDASGRKLFIRSPAISAIARAIANRRIGFI